MEQLAEVVSSQAGLSRDCLSRRSRQRVRCGLNSRGTAGDGVLVAHMGAIGVVQVEPRSYKGPSHLAT